MLDEEVHECPWCSASLTPGQTVCSSCGANITGDAGGDIPGVTEVDKSAVGVGRPPAITNRSRWRAWISGDSSDTLTESESKAVAPPDDAVREEMLRLELQAQVARLQAETDALLAEAAEEGRTIDIPPDLLSTAMGEPAGASETGVGLGATHREPAEPIDGAPTGAETPR
jgi:hypothetical protein